MTVIETPTEELRRFEFRAEPASDGLTLDGYAAVFNSPAQIDGWEGTFTEEIAPGAFKRSLGQRTPVLQFDHGQHPLIGSIPIGVIRSIREDAHGLRIRARLSDNWLIQPVRDAIRDGAVTGMSFRFRVIHDTWSHKGDMPHRVITEADVREAGPVVWPAYDATTVSVRSRQALAALSDPDVRAEVARLLFSGTGILPPADVDAPPDEARADVPADPPAAGHSEASRSLHTVRARLVTAGVLTLRKDHP